MRSVLFGCGVLTACVIGLLCVAAMLFTWQVRGSLSAFTKRHLEATKASEEIYVFFFAKVVGRSKTN